MSEVERLRQENEELRVQLARVETERQRQEVLVRMSPVGVLVVDAETRTVVSVNEEAERIIGVPSVPGTKLEEYQEVTMYRRADGRKYTAEERPLTRALDRGETTRAEEILLDRQGGGTVMTIVSATPIYSEEGEVASAVAVIQDITPLEEMERQRGEFLAMVSHELRSPLAAIKGCASSVLEAATPFDAAETLQFFRIINRQSDRLRDLISSLLDITRIEAGALSVDAKPAELVYLADEAKNTFMRGGERQRVEVHLAPGLPPVSADEQRIVQVMSNLLVNASQYSPEVSTIRVSASLVEDGLYAAISVTDEGMGIPDDRLSRMFKKFSRLDSGEWDLAGDGLGLAICKGIVEAHGGRIWAESEGLGHGSKFTFTLPVSQEAARRPSAGPVQESVRGSSADKRTRVLAVDDEPDLLRFLRKVIDGAGYTWYGTGHPTQALELLETKNPHIVLLDLVLPGMNGTDLMKRIREVSNAPVIFLSAHGDEPDVTNALRLGADDYLVKPFAPAELLARIEAVLRRRASSGQPETRQPYRAGDLAIDYANRGVTLSGEPVELTATEYKLLFELSIAAGRTLTRGHLSQRVWGEDYDDTGRLRSFVRNLRRKLGEEAGSPKYVFTEPGVGYRMAAP